MDWREWGEERDTVLKRESWRGWERREKKYLNNKIQSYGNSVNMHGYCINFGNAQCYRRTDLGRFWVKICKMIYF